MKLVNFKLLLQNATEKGVLLIMGCIIALIMSNSSAYDLYEGIINYHISLLGLQFSVLHFINDALMALFFLSVGMEIKREIIEGHLSKKEHLLLPLIAAAGGVIAPVIIYTAFNYNDPTAIRGWAVPAATDIAFALGVLALFGKNLPTSLRVFLAALAIIDDLIAVVIIAIFYGSNISFEFIALSIVITIALIALNKLGVIKLSIYMILGIILWYCVLHSGIHATIAGVILGLTIPLKSRYSEGSPLKILERNLSPYILYFILPIFAFANSGVNLTGISVLETLKEPVAMGIALGLFVGKMLGVMLSSYIAYKLNFVRIPEGATPLQFAGVAVICGIGFTMSLFVGTLAFPNNSTLIIQMKIGVLIGSLISTIFGGIILFVAKITKL